MIQEALTAFATPNVLFPAFPPLGLALGLGAGEGRLAVARRLKLLPDDPVVFIMAANPEPD